jgi:hypothetical protein
MLSSNSFPSLLIEFQEKKKFMLLGMGNMEDAGHGYAVFSLDSHTQTKKSNLLYCNGVHSPMHFFCDFFSPHISFQRGYRIPE